ncbi:primosomal protein N' [Polycladospora coralii]|nr:primosomal protein N' [Polycladospora coralii]
MIDVMHQYAEIYVDVPVKNTDRAFDYAIPESFRADIRVGSRVLVPFGPRKLIGYVTRCKTTTDTKRVKAILDVLDVTPPLTTELIQLGFYMADTYLCHTITAFQSMIPAVLKGKYRKVVTLGDQTDPIIKGEKSRVVDQLIQALQEKGLLMLEQALQIVEQDRILIRKLMEKGLIRVEEQVGDRVTKQKVGWLLPAEKGVLQEALIQLPKQAKKQRELVSYFIENHHEIPLQSLLTEMKTTRPTVRKLMDHGIIKMEERERFRDPYQNRTYQRTTPLPLTTEQQQAYHQMVVAIENGHYASVLLHGVTGSGKTEVYLQLIEVALKKGKECIVLVPEISLTPQMVERFKGRFGELVAVLHSGLSAGERFDEWRKIRSGQVKIAIGARSAIFAPFAHLGLIIIDEEHETTYKQEEHPKYHAREVANWRAQHHQALLVLGTATPAVETYYAARTGELTWVQMRERVQGRALPTIEVVDMREELKIGNRSMFSRALHSAIVACIEKGEQAVLFLNRRGFSTFVLCRECGETVACPHCEIALTYHQTNQSVRCHYCGYATGLPTECPSCQSRHIRHFGTGTQKVEEELKRTLENIRVIRMDVDTTGKKGAHERLLRQFGEGKADVLVGTQMIAKGLDFPKVTVVGVIAADTTLHLPHYKAGERTFQLLTQVSGRAGRHERPGRVFIQSYNGDHYSIDYAAHYQMESFYRTECQMRRNLHYPPYYGLFTLILSHPDRLKLMHASQQMARQLQLGLQDIAQLLGPVPASMPKLKDRYRMQMMIKYQLIPEHNHLVKEAVRNAIQTDDAALRIHVDREGRWTQDWKKD